MKPKITYPDWAEKYRTAGCTIRKVRDGYGLYKCTSKYVPGSYPKSVQTYLGMITEKDGFIPKTSVPSSPQYLEYGLSAFLMKNFKRSLERSTFNSGSETGHEFIKLGVINYMFSSVKPAAIRATYLSHDCEEALITRAETANPKRIKAISTRLGNMISNKIPNETDRALLERLLLLCVIDPVNPHIKPAYQDAATDITERYGLKHG